MTPQVHGFAPGWASPSTNFMTSAGLPFYPWAFAFLAMIIMVAIYRRDANARRSGGLTFWRRCLI